MTLEEQIKVAASDAARARWDLEYPSPTILRLEQDAEGDWKAVYIEPDTGTEEDVLVRRVGDELHAYAWGDESPHILKITSSAK